jgi:hypothetical protein
MKTRVILAASLLALVAALAGVVLGHGAAGSARAQARPGVVARGPFRTVSWGTDGTATVVRDTSGRLTLRLSRSFATQRAPELFVYLARHEHGVRTEWKELAPLRSAFGAQQYPLPASAAEINGLSVAIVCVKCNKTWGSARLSPAGTSRGSGRAPS